MAHRLMAVLLVVACTSARERGGSAASSAPTSSSGGGHEDSVPAVDTGDSVATYSPTSDTGGGDADGDGFVAVVDCDDADASAFPGAHEVLWDAVDSNCDGVDGTAGAFAEGPEGGVMLGAMLVVADWDDDSLDEVAASAPSNVHVWEYSAINRGAVGLYQSNLRRSGWIPGDESLHDFPLAMVHTRTAAGSRLVAASWESGSAVGRVYVLAPSDESRAHGPVGSVAVESFTGAGGHVVALGEVNGAVWATTHRWGGEPWTLSEVPVPFGQGSADAAEVVASGPGGFGRVVRHDADGVLITGLDSAYWFQGFDGEFDAASADSWLLGDGALGAAADLLHDADYGSLAVLGAPSDDSDFEDGGRVYVLDPRREGLGSTAPVAVIHADGVGRHWGTSVATGDMNGDGHDDVLVGAPGGSVALGSAHLFLGPLRGDIQAWDAAWSFFGTQQGDQTGQSVALGHFDNDGQADILVGRPGYDAPQRQDVGRIDRVLRSEMVWHP